MRIYRSKKRRGFSLVEITLALGIVGIALPVGIMSMLSSSRINTMSEMETKVTFAAQSVRLELNEALAGRGSILKGALGDITQVQDFILVADANGELLAKEKSEAYSTGSHLPEGRMIIRVDVKPLSDVRSQLLNLLQMEISLEFPAKAPRQKRQKVVFTERVVHE